MNDYVVTKTRTNNDYKLLFEEQRKVLKIQAKIIKEKDKEILGLYREISKLRHIIRTKKGLIINE